MNTDLLKKDIQMLAFIAVVICLSASAGYYGGYRCGLRAGNTHDWIHGQPHSSPPNTKPEYLK